MKHRFFVLIFIIIIAICAVITYFSANREGGAYAEIYSDGTLVQTVDLSEVSSPFEIPVENDGNSNTILVESGKISVISASCPDKLCVKRGAITNSSYPIVCLPNKLVIKISDNNTSAPDAVSR